MTVIEKNQGKKIGYEVQGNAITFGDGEIVIDLEARESDEVVRINICADDDHVLTEGLSKYYVANIIIPARSYDENGEAIPFSMENVKLVLWALIDINKEV